MRLDPIEGGRFIIVDDRILEWIGERIAEIGPGCPWEGARAIGVTSQGALIAGFAVAAHNRIFKTCTAAVAADTPKWATRGTIRAFLAWPFQQLGCERITISIAASNARSIRFNEGIGFVREGTLRKAFGDEDAYIYGLLKSETPEWMGFRN